MRVSRVLILSVINEFTLITVRLRAMKFIHLSDIHIGQSHNLENFASIVDWIVAFQSVHKSKVVVITGDIVDDGALGQYREAKQQIDKLTHAGLQVLCTPGNHDYGANGIVESEECVARFKKYISGDVDYPLRVDIDDHSFILIDSMLEEMNNYKLWGAQGEIGKAQLSELDRILNEINHSQQQRKIIVALHHHPFYYNYFQKLRDDELFKKVIIDEEKQSSRIDAIVFGHKHVAHRFVEKEQKYKLDLIYSAGASIERSDAGKLTIPVLDCVRGEIVVHDID